MVVVCGGGGGGGGVVVVVLVVVSVELIVLVKVVGIGIVDNPIQLDSIFALSACSDMYK